MSYELRPLSLAEILDSAFRLVQNEWKTLIGLSLIIQAPLVLITLRFPWLFDPFGNPLDANPELAEDLIVDMAVGFGGMGLAYLLLVPFVACAVTASVGNFYLGRAFGLGDAVRAGLAGYFRVVASYLVYVIALGAAGTALVLVGGFFVAALSASIGGLLEAAGTLGMVLGGLLAVSIVCLAIFFLAFTACVGSLLAPVVVLEPVGVFRAVERAFMLGASSMGRLVGIVLTAGFIVAVPVTGAQMLIGVIPGVGLLVWALFQAVGFAFTTAVSVVLYFDLRCRAESYDLELLAQQVEAGPGLGHG